MIYDVEFSLDAAAELLRITDVVGSAMLVLRAADQIRRHLENDPAGTTPFPVVFFPLTFNVELLKCTYVIQAIPAVIQRRMPSVA